MVPTLIFGSLELVTITLYISSPVLLLIFITFAKTSLYPNSCIFTMSPTCIVLPSFFFEVNPASFIFFVGIPASAGTFFNCLSCIPATFNTSSPSFLMSLLALLAILYMSASLLSSKAVAIQL